MMERNHKKQILLIRFFIEWINHVLYCLSFRICIVFNNKICTVYFKNWHVNIWQPKISLTWSFTIIIIVTVYIQIIRKWVESLTISGFHFSSFLNFPENFSPFYNLFNHNLSIKKVFCNLCLVRIFNFLFLK